MLIQVFARKVIDIRRSTKQEVKREADIMSELCRSDKTEDLNIVKILRHNTLPGSKGYYFIDMELGAFTLEDYVKSYFGTVDLDVDWTSCKPAIVPRNCSAITRIDNWCTIGIHIASGLSYMHSRRYVHRDLKPANGNPFLRNSNNSIVFPQGKSVEIDGFWNIGSSKDQWCYNCIIKRNTMLSSTGALFRPCQVHRNSRYLGTRMYSVRMSHRIKSLSWRLRCYAIFRKRETSYFCTMALKTLA